MFGKRILNEKQVVDNRNILIEKENNKEPG
jgi:hypothetical protein